MPIILLLVGALLIIVSVNDRLGDLTKLLKADFTSGNGQPGFHLWIVAIFVIGAIGYYKPFKPAINAFLGLLILAIFLSKGGLYAKFTQAIKVV